MMFTPTSMIIIKHLLKRTDTNAKPKIYLSLWNKKRGLRIEANGAMQKNSESYETPVGCMWRSEVSFQELSHALRPVELVYNKDFLTHSDKLNDRKH
jgi:hypothetical protein